MKLLHKKNKKQNNSHIKLCINVLVLPPVLSGSQRNVIVKVEQKLEMNLMPGKLFTDKIK